MYMRVWCSRLQQGFVLILSFLTGHVINLRVQMYQVLKRKYKRTRISEKSYFLNTHLKSSIRITFVKNSPFSGWLKSIFKINFIFLLNIFFSLQLGGKLYKEYHLEVRAKACRFFTVLITPNCNDVIVVYGFFPHALDTNSNRRPLCLIHWASMRFKSDRWDYFNNHLIYTRNVVCYSKGMWPI
jgi:hypothetical protein